MVGDWLYVFTCLLLHSLPPREQRKMQDLKITDQIVGLENRQERRIPRRLYARFPVSIFPAALFVPLLFSSRAFTIALPVGSSSETSCLCACSSSGSCPVRRRWHSVATSRRWWTRRRWYLTTWRCSRCSLRDNAVMTSSRARRSPFYESFALCASSSSPNTLSDCRPVYHLPKRKVKQLL